MMVAGVDVGAEKKGFHVVMLEGNSARCFHREKPSEVRDRCARAEVIAIDAPCGWACQRISPTGRSRQAERDLKALRGVQSFYTPTRTRAAANKNKNYDWVFNGEKLCVTCGRPFIRRKKWELVWDEVKYCSDGCRQRARRGREVTDDVLRIRC